MKISKKVLAIGAVGLGIAGLWLSRGPSEDANSKLMFGRVWLDKVPERATDYAQVFGALEDDPLSVFQKSSSYEGAWALYGYELRGEGKILFMFAQDKSRHEAKFRAWECNENGYDYCLELDGAPRGPKRYYSKKGWEFDGGEAGMRETARGILSAR